MSSTISSSTPDIWAQSTPSPPAPPGRAPALRPAPPETTRPPRFPPARSAVGQTRPPSPEPEAPMLPPRTPSRRRPRRRQPRQRPHLVRSPPMQCSSSSRVCSRSWDNCRQAIRQASPQPPARRRRSRTTPLMRRTTETTRPGQAASEHAGLGPPRRIQPTLQAPARHKPDRCWKTFVKLSKPKVRLPSRPGPLTASRSPPPEGRPNA